MPDEKRQATPVAKVKPGQHRFQEGHPRFGGKQKNSASVARAMAVEMGCDPLAFLMDIINGNIITQTVIVEGKRKRVEISVPLDVRVDCAKVVSNYLYPRLTAQQITGRDDGPLAIAAFDVTQLLRNPEMVEMAQKMAIAMSEADRAPACIGPAGEPQSERPAPDLMGTLRTDNRGHWLR